MSFDIMWGKSIYLTLVILCRENEFAHIASSYTTPTLTRKEDDIERLNL